MGNSLNQLHLKNRLSPAPSETLSMGVCRITLVKDLSLRRCLVWCLMWDCPAHGGWCLYSHELLGDISKLPQKSQGASHLATFFHSFCFKPLPWLPSVTDYTVPSEIDLFSAPKPLKENIASDLVFRLTILDLCHINVFFFICIFKKNILLHDILFSLTRFHWKDSVASSTKAMG